MRALRNVIVIDSSLYASEIHVLTCLLLPHYLRGAARLPTRNHEWIDRACQALRMISCR